MPDIWSEIMSARLARREVTRRHADEQIGKVAAAPPAAHPTPVPTPVPVETVIETEVEETAVIEKKPKKVAAPSAEE